MVPTIINRATLSVAPVALQTIQHRSALHRREFRTLFAHLRDLFGGGEQRPLLAQARNTGHTLALALAGLGRLDLLRSRVIGNEAMMLQRHQPAIHINAVALVGVFNDAAILAQPLDPWRQLSRSRSRARARSQDDNELGA